MDAHALLKSQGWRGSGHTLHFSDDCIGLAKPILAARKSNTLGIGGKNHVTSDQWWLDALDEQLKSLDTSNKTSIIQTKTHTTRLDSLLTSGRAKHADASALYAYFVSGGIMQGTIGENETDSAVSAHAPPESESQPVVSKEYQMERRARGIPKRMERAEKQAREAEAVAMAARATEREFKRKDDRTMAKLQDSTKSNDKLKKHRKSTKSDRMESKEQRRARRADKRKQRAEKGKQHKGEEV